MVKKLSISEFRKELPQILKELQSNPEAIYQISVNQAVMGELVSPRKLPKPGQATQKLLRLSKKFERAYKRRVKPTPVSEQHDQFIYR